MNKFIVKKTSKNQYSIQFFPGKNHLPTHNQPEPPLNSNNQCDFRTLCCY